MPRRLKLALAAVTLLLVGAATAAVALSRDDEPGTEPARPAAPGATGAGEPGAQVLVVRRRGGVPPSWTRRARRAPGVTGVAVMERAQVLLRGSRRSSGERVDSAPAGYAFPLDVLVVQPRRYAGLLPQAARAMRTLRRGTAVLSQTSARLRRLEPGDRMTLAGGRGLRVAGVVDDDLVGFAEVVLTAPDAGAGNSDTRQLLVATTEPERAARRLGRSDAVRIRPLSPTLRTSPRLVARALETKSAFGEFAVGVPYGRDWIRIDPRWVDRNVITRSVPILGPVTCHRRLFPALRRALRSLERRGLSNVVDRADYAGCFAPRRIPGSDRSRCTPGASRSTSTPPQSAAGRIATGPAARARDGGRRLHLGRALADGSRPDALRASSVAATRFNACHWSRAANHPRSSSPSSWPGCSSTPSPRTRMPAARCSACSASRSWCWSC